MVEKKIRRRGYVRRAYTRKDGTKVKATRVKSSLIKKQGLTTGKRGLIPIRKNLHLRKFGYALSKPTAQRHNALKKAIKEYGKNWVVRRLTALANIRPQREKYARSEYKLRSDVVYTEKLTSSKKNKKTYKPRGLARKELSFRRSRRIY